MHKHNNAMEPEVMPKREGVHSAAFITVVAEKAKAEKRNLLYAFTVQP